MGKGLDMSLDDIKRMLAKSDIFQKLAAGDIKGLQQAFTPQLTTTQRNALSAGAKFPGMQIYNTSTNKLNLWNGTVWEVVTSA